MFNIIDKKLNVNENYSKNFFYILLVVKINEDGNIIY